MVILLGRPSDAVACASGAHEQIPLPRSVARFASWLPRIGRRASGGAIRFGPANSHTGTEIGCGRQRGKSMFSGGTGSGPGPTCPLQWWSWPRVCRGGTASSVAGTRCTVGHCRSCRPAVDVLVLVHRQELGRLHAEPRSGRLAVPNKVCLALQAVKISVPSHSYRASWKRDASVLL